MAESERKYDASERKLIWLRLHGYLAISSPAASFCSILGAIFAIALTWRWLTWACFCDLMKIHLICGEVSTSHVVSMTAASAWSLLILLGPPLGGASIGWILGVVLQTGCAFTIPKLGHHSPGYYVPPHKSLCDRSVRWCMGLLVLVSLTVTIEKMLKELLAMPAAWYHPSVAVAVCCRPVLVFFLPTLLGVVVLDVVVGKILHNVSVRMSETEKRRELEEAEPGQITKSRRRRT